MNSKGQFSIIAALLVSVVLIATVVITYSMIRNSPTEALPQVQSAIDETNLALKQILGFTIGYYGSVLQVTGNSSYAKILATNYLQSGLVNVANMHPDWGASFNVPNETIFLSTNWFTNTSYSRGGMSVAYNLTRLGLSGITYQASANLSVQVGRAASINQAELIVTGDGKPVVNLGKQNFKFYRYSYSNSTFGLISPSTVQVASANGTYLLGIPSGVDPYSYAVQVVDQRGIMVTVWSFNHYVITLTWNSLYSTLKGETIVMELLQNGTIRWLGQNLQTTQTVPIPPIPVKAIHINQTTINGINREVPFQIEDWNNNYQVPAGLTGNATVFSNRQMIVFLVNHNVTKVTVWWDGRDIAKQTSYAYTNRYFKNDDPTHGILTNGILKLDLNNWLTSTVGSSTAKADFMRINGKTPTYGSNLAYIIHNGIVRDVIHQEAEWGSNSTWPGGIPNCPNVYSQIVITLPANATYYTYQLRLMFVTSQQNRIITDVCPIKLTDSIGQPQTENGTSSGDPCYPIVSSSTGLFYNVSASIWAHHWSQYVSSGTKGAGIMFTDDTNMKLYCFDRIAGQKTGGLKIIGSGPGGVIEFDPVGRSQYPASFKYALDVAWYGAVVTFDGTTPIYNNSTKSGLWITVEDPPKLTVITSNFVSITVTSSPSGSGYVKVDGNAITTPYTFTWTTGSNHTLQAISPVNGTGTRYNWTSWSDGGNKTHTYTVPSQSTTVTANYKTQYQLSFAVSPSGGGTTTPSGTNIWVDKGTISISATPNSGYALLSWSASGSISIVNPSWASTTATINGPGTITAAFSSSTVSITVTSGPAGLGYLMVDGNAITTPYTFTWATGSTHTLQALSPVAGAAGTQYVWTGWSDGGNKTHTYTVPSSSTTVTANYKTQYQVSFAVNPSGSGTTSPSGTNVWEDAGSLSISASANSGYHFSSWSATSGITIASPQSSSTTATINAPGTITATFKRNIALDGSASSYTTTSSITVSLTTSYPNDLIYLSVTEGTSITVSSVASTGLTWNYRTTATYTGTGGVRVETWYAISSSSGSISITITLSGNGNAAAVAFGISGANTTSPFDGNAVTNTGSGSPATASKTTTNANDFIIGAVGVNSNPSITVTTGSGFTLIGTQASGTTRETSDQYRIVSATGTYTPSYSSLSGNNWAMIVDAIKQAS